MRFLVLIRAAIVCSLKSLLKVVSLEAILDEKTSACVLHSVYMEVSAMNLLCSMVTAWLIYHRVNNYFLVNR